MIDLDRSKNSVVSAGPIWYCSHIRELFAEMVLYCLHVCIYKALCVYVSLQLETSRTSTSKFLG